MDGSGDAGPSAKHAPKPDTSDSDSDAPIKRKVKKQATKRKASGSGPAKAGKKAKGAAANAKPPLKPLPGKARLVNLSHLWLGKTESRLQPYIPETYKDCLIFRGLDSFNRSQRLRLERIKQNGEPRKGNILKTETVSGLTDKYHRNHPWKVPDCLREFIQNKLDECKDIALDLGLARPELYSEEVEEGRLWLLKAMDCANAKKPHLAVGAVEVLYSDVLLIHQVSSSLGSDTLLMKSDKGQARNSDSEDSDFEEPYEEDKIGGFGEGYKKAILILMKAGYQVLYILHDEVWEFKRENITKSSTSRGYRKLQVKPHVHGKLQADKTPPPEPNNNYHFTIAVRGPDVAQAWGTLRERVLCYSKLSKSYLNTGVHDKAIALLPSEIPAGSVYVRGLYICEEPKFVALGIAVNCKVEVNPLRNRVEYPDDLNDLIVQLAGEPGQDWVWKAGVVEDSQEPSDKAAGVFRDLPGLIDIIKAQAVRRTRQKGKKHTVLVSPAHSDHYLVDVLRQFHEVDLVSVAFDYDTKSQAHKVFMSLFQAASPFTLAPDGDTQVYARQRAAYDRLKAEVEALPRVTGFQLRNFPAAEAVVDEEGVVYAAAALLDMRPEESLFTVCMAGQRDQSWHAAECFPVAAAAAAATGGDEAGAAGPLGPETADQNAVADEPMAQVSDSDSGSSVSDSESTSSESDAGGVGDVGGFDDDYPPPATQALTPPVSEDNTANFVVPDNDTVTVHGESESESEMETDSDDSSGDGAGDGDSVLEQMKGLLGQLQSGQLGQLVPTLNSQQRSQLLQALVPGLTAEERQLMQQDAARPDPLAAPPAAAAADADQPVARAAAVTAVAEAGTGTTAGTGAAAPAAAPEAGAVAAAATPSAGVAVPAVGSQATAPQAVTAVGQPAARAAEKLSSGRTWQYSGHMNWRRSGTSAQPLTTRPSGTAAKRAAASAATAAQPVLPAATGTQPAALAAAAPAAAAATTAEAAQPEPFASTAATAAQSAAAAAAATAGSDDDMGGYDGGYAGGFDDDDAPAAVAPATPVDGPAAAVAACSKLAESEPPLDTLRRLLPQLSPDDLQAAVEALLPQLTPDALQLLVQAAMPTLSEQRRQQVLQGLSPDDLLASLSPEQYVAVLAKRLEGASPEDSAEMVRAMVPNLSTEQLMQAVMTALGVDAQQQLVQLALAALATDRQQQVVQKGLAALAAHQQQQLMQAAMAALAAEQQQLIVQAVMPAAAPAQAAPAPMPAPAAAEADATPAAPAAAPAAAAAPDKPAAAAGAAAEQLGSEQSTFVDLTADSDSNDEPPAQPGPSQSHKRKTQRRAIPTAPPTVDSVLELLTKLSQEKRYRALQRALAKLTDENRVSMVVSLLDKLDAEGRSEALSHLLSFMEGDIESLGSVIDKVHSMLPVKIEEAEEESKPALVGA